MAASPLIIPNIASAWFIANDTSRASRRIWGVLRRPLRWSPDRRDVYEHEIASAIWRDFIVLPVDSRDEASDPLVTRFKIPGLPTDGALPFEFQQPRHLP
jgi:hypothetical protein